MEDSVRVAFRYTSNNPEGEFTSGSPFSGAVPQKATSRSGSG